MREMLDLCQGFPIRKLAPGDVLLKEGGQSYQLFVLVEGAIEVCRADITIAFVPEPGSIFGEMSLLLRIPHTADVRAVAPSEVIVIDHPLTHLRDCCMVGAGGVSRWEGQIRVGRAGPRPVFGPIWGVLSVWGRSPGLVRPDAIGPSAGG